MQGMLFLLVWGIWLAIAIGIGRLFGWISRRGWIIWFVSPVIFVLPLADAFIGIPLAERWAERVGTNRMTETVTTPGFLQVDLRDSKDLVGLYSWFESPHRYAYVEVEYTEDTPVSFQPAVELSPGFYQFRLSDPNHPTCSDLFGELPPGVYQGPGNGCFRMTRTDAPISRYSVEHGATLRPGSWEKRLGIEARCTLIQEIETQRDIAHQCTFTFNSWLDWLGPQWHVPTPGTVEILEAFEVIVPPSVTEF